MKLEYYLVVLVFSLLVIIGCGDGSGPTSPNSNVDVTGTWNMTASGTIVGDTGDCTGTPPTTTTLTQSYIFTTNGSFSITSSGSPCDDTTSSSYADYCSGNWTSTASTVTAVPAYMADAYAVYPTLYGLAFTYTLNSDGTIMFQFLQTDSTMDDVDNPDGCQYGEYTKQ